MAFSNFAVQTFEVYLYGNDQIQLMGTTYFYDLVVVFRFETGGQFKHGFFRWNYT